MWELGVKRRGSGRKNGWKREEIRFSSFKICHYISANHPDLVGTVPIFDFQNFQKSGCPDFLEFSCF